jgi:hypothetical protein
MTLGYLNFPPPVAPVFGAVKGDPKNPSFHKPAWLLKLEETRLVNSRPWTCAKLCGVNALSFLANPTFKARKSKCLMQAQACLNGDGEVNCPSSKYDGLTSSKE